LSRPAACSRRTSRGRQSLTAARGGRLLHAPCPAPRPSSVGLRVGDDLEDRVAEVPRPRDLIEAPVEAEAEHLSEGATRGEGVDQRAHELLELGTAELGGPARRRRRRRPEPGSARPPSRLRGREVERERGDEREDEDGDGRRRGARSLSFLPIYWARPDLEGPSSWTGPWIHRRRSCRGRGRSPQCPYIGRGRLPEPGPARITRIDLSHALQLSGQSCHSSIP
jgi:hypothetical protein